MHLLHLESENVLGLPDGGYAFGKPGRGALAGATVITGASGAGKTSLLAAIVFGREVLAKYGPPEKPEAMLRAGAKRGSLRIVFGLDEAEVAGAATPAEGEAADPPEDARTVDLTIELAAGAPEPSVSKAHRALFGRFGEPAARGALEYFPDNRALDVVGSPTDKDQEKRRRPTRAAQKYAGLVPWLRARAAGPAPSTGDDPFSRVRVALQQLSPGLELLGLSTGEAPELLFEVGGAQVPLPRLSSAQRQAVLIAGTLVRFHLETGLVLIDQPELHLHGDDHERFVHALSEIARDAQLVLATGSSGVLAAVARGQRISLETGAKVPRTTKPSLPADVSPPKPSAPAAAGPSALVSQPPAARPALQGPSEATIPAHEQPARRESPLFTPSYLQPQSPRAPEPYVPMAQVPAPPAPASTPVQAPPVQAPPIHVLPMQSPAYQAPAHAAAPHAAPPPAPAHVVIRPPLQEPASVPTRTPLSPEDAAVLARMKQGVGDGSADSTAFMAPIPTEVAARAKQLPFRPAAPGLAAPAPSPAPPPPSAPSVQSGRTVAGSSGARPSMPFMGRGAPQSASVPPGWTLQRYAVLCIDLYANQNPPAEVLVHAGITQEQRQAIDDYWQQKMREDPALRAEWKVHADRRQAELQGPRR
jgi:hypothetical protein